MGGYLSRRKHTYNTEHSQVGDLFMRYFELSGARFDHHPRKRYGPRIDEHLSREHLFRHQVAGDVVGAWRAQRLPDRL